MAGSMYLGNIFEEAAHIPPQLPSNAANNNPALPSSSAHPMPLSSSHAPADASQPPSTHPSSTSWPATSPPQGAHHPHPQNSDPEHDPAADHDAENDADRDDDDDDDEDDDDDDLANERAADEHHHQQTGTGGARKRRKAELHRRHSKRYRDNLGELFSSLEDLLPKVVPNCKLKTKNQIIATSVQAVTRLREEVASLEMRYVLSSPANRTKWVEDIVKRARSFSEVAEPFMRLLVGIQRWKHSELWGRFEVDVRPDGTDSGKPVRAPTNTVANLGPFSSDKFFLKLLRTASAQDAMSAAIPTTYVRFSEQSQLLTFVAGDDSLVGRIANSLSPEWIDLCDPESCAGFKRVELARESSFRLCFAVPILVRGHVFATILFFDDRQRPDLREDVNIAQDLASCLGNCYGASTMRREEAIVKANANAAANANVNTGANGNGNMNGNGSGNVNTVVNTGANANANPSPTPKPNPSTSTVPTPNPNPDPNPKPPNPKPNTGASAEANPAPNANTNIDAGE